jgi:hypothetical protein
MIYDIFYVSKKEIVDNEWKAFRQRFPSAQKIENVKTINDIKKKSFTKFFWLVWDDQEITEDFNFEYRVEKWDEKYIHTFKTQYKDKEYYRAGVCLVPKSSSISQKEFDFRFFINKKEIPTIVSKFKFTTYKKYYIDSYEDYLKICKQETQSLFWRVPSDIEIIDNSIFDLHFDPLDSIYDYDRSINHMFKNDSFYDGLMLASKDKVLMEKEFKYRFPIENKEWDIVVSTPKPYDVVFISYNESNADVNYEKLKLKRPDAKRVHGVKGIHNAHIAAAKLVGTEMFWVVDADADLVDDFNFDIQYFPYYDAGNRLEQQSTVHVWFSQNPINDLVYGYGGVKLLPTKLTLEMDTASVDMTTSISEKFKVVDQISNISVFNVDEFSTWKSAFRECAKLASKIIDNNDNVETDDRLEIWVTTGKDRMYGDFAIAGATAGKAFAQQHWWNEEQMSKINDFDWLKTEFEKCPIALKK